jgi:DNA-binding NarL/FixJ family response regulator
MVRAGLRAILEAESDFEIVGESSTARELPRLVDDTRPDVVLLDARMPDVDGATATRELAASHPDVAVLIVSTYADEHLVEECIKAGARGYVVKDIERFSLKEGIRAVSRGEAAMSPVVAAGVLDRLRTTEADRPKRPAGGLSDTQLEILRLIANGFSNREIATRVFLSENTVKSHVQEIFRKLRVTNRVEAAVRASREGWL